MKKLLIIPVLLFNLVVTGTNYYVKNAGNDSNSGLNDANAWAHHPWMSTWTGTVVLKPGDIVYMKRGDIWTIENPDTPFMTVKQSGNPGSPIITTAYSTGAAPIIKISTATDKSVVLADGKSYLNFDNLHIQHHSSTFAAGRYGFLLYNVCHHITFTNNEIDNIPTTGIHGSPNCYYIIVGDTTANQVATTTSHSNHIHDFGYGGVILLGVNPTNNESNFYVYYNYIHDATRTGNGDNEYGIAFTANAASTAWPKYATARYNRVENIDTWEGIECHGGSYIYFLDNYIKNFGTCGILIAGSTGVGELPETCDHIYAERNVVEQSDAGWVKGRENAFICQYLSSTAFHATNINIQDNIIRYTSRPTAGDFFGIRAGNIDGLTISGNKIYNGAVVNGNGGIFLNNNYGTFGNKNVTISMNFISEWGPGMDFIGSSITGSVSVINNIVTKPGGNGCIIVRNNDISATGAVTIYNNIFIQDTYTRCFQSSYGIAAGGSVIAKNNIFGSVTSLPIYYWYWGGTISGKFTCDHNLYWNCSSDSPFYQGGSARNWTAWTTTLEHDTHGTGPNTNPLFRNPGGSYLQDIDFTLQSTSPSINKGTNVGLSTDYAGNPISGLPDIGAYEHQPAAPPSPTLIGSVVENATPSRLEMTYSLSLANIVPASSAFTVRVNSATRTVNSVTISGAKVLLNLANPIAYGDAITVAYTKPSTNPLQTPAGGQAATISAQSVTNMVAAPIPVYVSAAIESSTPSLLEITYNLALANIVPAVSAFTVEVNSITRILSSVSISGTKVLLTLYSPVVYGDVVSIAYIKPSTNPLQTPAGGQAATITAQAVTNKIAVINSAPVIVVTPPQSSYSGFVNEINARGSYDKDKDNLTFTWSAPLSVPLSSTSGATIKFLGPIVNEPTIVEFTVRVSDGKTSRSKVIPLEILPYKPELEVAEVSSVEASSYNSQNNPYNIIDGNKGTMWSADGIDQWLVIELKKLFSIQHIILAFQPGQKRESYFDVLGSDDKETWEPILTKSASCDFSGELQVFDFPPSKAGKEYKYVKLVGKGSNADSWNYVSEFKIYGYRHPNPSFYESMAVKLYPNPASKIINIRIDEPTMSTDFIRIINLLGKIVFQYNLDPDIREFQIPLSLKNGTYIVQMGLDDLTLFAQKLIVSLK